MLEPGRRLAHYEIVRLLGKGGMGEVYLARDDKLGREVALKLLPAELAGSAERRQRFEREARAVAALQHPSIVTLHAIEDHDGLAFLVMEYIDGEPLGDAIPRQGLALARFLELAIPLADAVAAAHARGITHRDLKPANVLVDRDGRVRILDFGLARIDPIPGLAGDSIEPTEALTGEGRVVGTVAYMSPEQVEGRAVDPRSDIFALGVLFYEMAAGVRPFTGDTSMSVLTSILRDEPVAVTERNAALPRYLGRIIRRCLQKDPERRYQSALDLRNDLLELKEELDSGELTAPAAVAAARRSRGLLPLALAAALAVAAAGWWFAGSGRGKDGSIDVPAPQVRRLTAQGNPEAVALSPDGAYVAYESEGPGGRSLRLQQIASGSDIELVPALGWSTNIADLAFSPDSAYVRYAVNEAGSAKTLWEVPALGGSPRQLLDGILLGPTLSPDGTRAVFVPGDAMVERWQRLVVAPLGDGEPTVVHQLSGTADFDSLAWSPTGDRIAAAIFDEKGLRIELLSVDGGEPEVVPTEPFSGIDALCWVPDATALILSASAGEVFQLWRVELEDGSRRRLLNDTNQYDTCGVATTRSRLATIRLQVLSQIWMVPLNRPREARVVRTTSGRADGADGLGWLDAETLTYSAPTTTDWELWKVSAAGGTSAQLTTRGASSATAGRSGRMAFTSGWTQGLLLGIYTVEANGTGLRRLTPPDRFAARPSVSPDGQWLFHHELRLDGMALMRRPFDGGEAVPLVRGNAHLVSYSPDGTRFNVHVRDPETGTWGTAIFPADFGPRLATLDLHSETYSPWDTDHSLLISRSVDGTANLYRYDVEDGSETQVTFFTDGRIFSFDVSPDFTRVAVGRGELINELLLIDDY